VTIRTQAQRGQSGVAIGTDFHSKIVRLNVGEYGGKLVCQKGAPPACGNAAVEMMA